MDHRAANTGICSFSKRGIAHPETINSEDRHMVIHYQIANHCICHVLRFLYPGLSPHMRVALDLNNKTFLPLQLRRDLV